MSWPTPQEYNEAIQTPQISFADPDLRAGTVELTPIGIPRAMTGAFASVYKVSSNVESWAVRCFLVRRADQKERYERISEFVLMDDLDATVQFHYLDQGIRVHGLWYPILKMTWVEGRTLDSYLIDNYRQSGKVRNILRQFEKLVRGLDQAGMAHGDLQHGNIMVTGNGLRLVDYDALYVPALAGKTSLELGHPNYQHPERTPYHYDSTVDNFSCWLISLSLRAVAIDPHLFTEFSGGDECILFRRTDLKSPESSPLFNTLLNHPSDALRADTEYLIRMLWANPETIPELHEIEQLVALPNVKPVPGDSPAEGNGNISLTDIADSTRFKDDGGLSDHVVGKRRPKREGVGRRLVSRLSGLWQRGVEYVAPGRLITRRLNEGDRSYREGKYNLAIAKYLEAYRTAEKICDHPLYEKDYLTTCFKLGYAYLEQGDLNLATNYFLIGYNYSSQFEDERRSFRLAFLLSLARFQRQESTTGFKMLRDNPRILLYLDGIVEAELKRGLIDCPTALRMLLGVFQGVSFDRPDSPELKGLIAATLRLYSEAGEDVPIDQTRECAVLFLHVAHLDYLNDDFQSCLRNIMSFLDLAKVVVDREGHVSPDESADDYIEALTKTAGITIDDARNDVLKFVAVLLRMLRCESNEELEPILARLIEDDVALLKKSLLAFYLERDNAKVDFVELARRAQHKKQSVVLGILALAALHHGEPAEIASHLTLLSESSSDFRRFLYNVVDSRGERFALSAMMSLVDDVFEEHYASFESIILRVGSVEAAVRTMKTLLYREGTESLSRFASSVIDTRNRQFIIDLLSSFSLPDDEQLLRDIYDINAEKLGQIFREASIEDGIVNHIELLYMCQGLDGMRDFISSLVLSKNEYFILDLVEAAARSRFITVAGYTAFLIYYNSLGFYQYDVLKELLREGRLEVIAWILYRLGYHGEQTAIETLGVQVKASNVFGFEAGGFDWSYVSDYIDAASLVASSMTAGCPTRKYELWKEQVAGTLEKIRRGEVRDNNL